jgi:CHAT domain-containing protein
MRDSVFAQMLIRSRAIPRLVFLHLCESATVDSTANFAGLAPQLIQAGVQAVVAMQYPITNRAAISFSRGFYRELAKGRAVDEAVQEGRWRITMDENAQASPSFGAPVLYMRSRDGIILPAGASPS